MALPRLPIEISARILLVQGDRVLLANQRGENWFFLPGGNVLLGESVEAALYRELDAETGIDVDMDDVEFIGCVEHVYGEGHNRYHELNVVFGAAMPPRSQIGSLKDEIDIVSIALREVPSLELRPAALADIIIGWTRDHRPGWRPAPVAA